MRLAALRAGVAAGAYVVAVTEVLSALQALDRVAIAFAWTAFLAVALFWFRGILVRLPRPGTNTEAAIAISVIAGIAAVVLVTALASAPNSADALSYHLPRIVFWSQAHSVAFFPTAYLNQIMLQPVAEYLMLHLYLLAGGDWLVNLVQFAGYTGSIIAVSLLAGLLGLTWRGQLLASLLCATLPNVILQASGAKNDLLLAFWIICGAVFARRREWIWLGLAAGLALGTKGTAYLFLPALLLGVGAFSWKVPAAVAIGALLLNGPQFARNVDLSGSPMGFDSAHADGFFRWRNERFGWQETTSNALRHAADQVGSRSEAWNDGIYRTVLRTHDLIGISANDPATTWRWSQYAAPLNSNHEANANNKWHLLLAVAAGLAFVRDRRWLLFAGGLVLGFLLFCFYLKWQPFSSRLLAPLFIASCPLSGALLDRLSRWHLHVLVLMLLLAAVRLPLTENWTRPLSGPRSILTTPRSEHLFYDTAQWNNRQSYVDAVRIVRKSGCRTVGLDMNVNHVVYPFMAHLAGVRFTSTGVHNPSAKYKRDEEQPCAVLCLDCVGVAERLRQYSGYPGRHDAGRFVVFTKTYLSN